MAGMKPKVIGEDLKRYIAERREHKPKYPPSIPMLLEAEEKEKDKQQDMLVERIVKTWFLDVLIQKKINLLHCFMRSSGIKMPRKTKRWSPYHHWIRLFTADEIFARESLIDGRKDQASRGDRRV